MQSIYPVFYRLHGIRRPQNLMSPVMLPFDQFPRESIWHYIDEQSEDLDPHDPLFAQYKNRILVDFITLLSQKPNNAVQKTSSVNTQAITKHFFVQNKKFQFRPNAVKVVTDPQSLVVINYNYIDHFYNYTKLPTVGYLKWNNKITEVFKKINEYCSMSSRHHFLMLKLPKETPSVSMLTVASKKFTNQTMSVLDTPVKWFILELWKWLDPATRSTSALSVLDKKHFNHVTLVFTNEDNLTSCLNLGYMNSWIKGEDNQTEFKVVPQFQPLIAQKLFLRFVLSAHSKVEEVEPQPESEDQNQDHHTEQQDTEDTEDTDNEEGDEIEPHYATKPKSKEPENKGPQLLSDQDLDRDIVESPDLEEELKKMDEDLETLDRIEKKKMKDKGVTIKDGEFLEDQSEEQEIEPVETIKEKIHLNLDSKSSLLMKLEENAETGLLSAADYRKLQKEIEASFNRKDPYGSGKLVEEMKVVKQEDLAIKPDRAKIADHPRVIDKSMTESTLLSMDYTYVNSVYKKDVLAAVDSIQKAGIIVKKHEVEVDHSALGSYEYHTIELRPLDGAPSTIRVKLPIVSDEGTFNAAGSKYHMRKQRVD